MMERAGWQRRVLWLGFLLGFLWPCWRLLTSDGWILDDELAHYMLSRSVLEWPSMLLDAWARPGRSLIHFPVTAFGLTVTRMYTLGLAMLAVWVTILLGRKLGLKLVAVIPVLLCFQVWFPDLSYAVLTQTPFMLLWVLGCWLGATKRWHWAGVCFGYLSLIRHEGILLAGLWGLWVSSQEGGFLYGVAARLRGKKAMLGTAVWRDTLLGISTVTSILIYNAASYWVKGELPFAMYFESKPQDHYGSGSLWHYAAMLRPWLGGVSLLLAAVGALSLFGKMRSWSLLFLTYPTYFIFQSWVFWKGLYASGGYYHFIMPMAPFFALLGARALELWPIGEKWQRARMAGVTATLLAVVWQGMHLHSSQHNHQDWAAVMAGDTEYQTHFIAPPIARGRTHQAVIEAAEYVEEQYPEAIVLCPHVLYHFYTENVDTPEVRASRYGRLSQLPVGSVLIWEAKYSDLEGRTSYDEMVRNPNWEVVKTWEKAYPAEGAHRPQDFLQACVFRKVSQRPFDEDLTPKGPNLSY